MAIAHVANTSQNAVTTTPVTLARTALATGNLMVVTSSTAVANGSITTYSISDTQGNTWTNWMPHFSAPTSAGLNCAISWYAIAKNTTATTITVTCTGSATYLDLLYDEFSGTATSGSVITPTNTAASSGTSMSVSVTPTTDNTMLYAWGGGSSSTIGSGFSAGATENSNGGDIAEFKLLGSGTSGVSQACTMSNGSGTWAMLAGVINLPAAGVTADFGEYQTEASYQKNYERLIFRDHLMDEGAHYPPAIPFIEPFNDWSWDNAQDSRNLDVRTKDDSSDYVGLPIVPTLAFDTDADYQRDYSYRIPGSEIDERPHSFFAIPTFAYDQTSEFQMRCEVIGIDREAENASFNFVAWQPVGHPQILWKDRFGFSFQLFR